MKPKPSLPPESAGDPPEKLLTTDEVAAWLGIQRCTLEKARSTGMGHFPPFIRVGRSIRYQRGAVATWLAGRAFNVDGTSASSPFPMTK